MGFAVRVLCRPQVAAGFRLAGLQPLEAADPADGARRLGSLLHDPSLGVLLVEQGFYEALPEATRHELARRPLPMVVPFPGPAWAAAPEGAESFIAELLRQAIGYRVRVR